MNLEQFIKKHKTEFDDKVMSDDAQSLFEARLQNEVNTVALKKQIPIRYLAIAASLVLMFSLGYLYNASVNKRIETRNQLVLALNEDTASDRLEAVYEIEENFKKEDKLITEILFNKLQNDPNANVKIATIDALLKFPNSETIRLQLVKALEKEKEPLVQIKLIESLTLLREQRATQPLQDIIDDKEALPSVKGFASASLAMLNQ